MNKRARPYLLALAGITLAGCSDYSYTQKTMVDVFRQRRRRAVDVLMVVDDSCSMVEEQENLAANFSSFISAFDGAEVDWQLAVVTTDMVSDDRRGRMVGGDDEILFIDAAGRTLERVNFDRSWAIEPGVAMQLDPSQTSATGNDSATAWCRATSAFGGGDLGTPGAENDGCGLGGDPVPLPVGEPGAPRAPAAGEVVVTEFLADPGAVDDAVGEWVELANLSGADLDLAGCALADAGRNRATFPAGTVLAAGQRLVVGRSAEVADNGGAPVAVVPEGLFTLNNNVVVLTKDAPGAEDIFSEMVAVGTSGAGIETGLAGARAALTEPLLSGENAGFLRDDANLSVIFVSDENDYSGEAVDDYYRFFGDLKGAEAYRDHGIVNFSAVVGRDVPAYNGEPSCQSDRGAAAYGARYVDLSTRTEGAVESICAEDWAPVAVELGLTVSGLDLEFALSEPCDFSSLVVKLYAGEDEDSLIGELVQGEDYTFVASRNAIRFEPARIPPPESTIVAEYKVLAASSTSEDTGAP